MTEGIAPLYIYIATDSSGVEIDVPSLPRYAALSSIQVPLGRPRTWVNGIKGFDSHQHETKFLVRQLYLASFTSAVVPTVPEPLLA